jgi:hypothetical protein
LSEEACENCAAFPPVHRPRSILNRWFRRIAQPNALVSAGRIGPAVELERILQVSA